MNQLIATNKNGELTFSKTQECEILSKIGEGKILLTFEKWIGKPTRNQLGYFFAAIVHDKAVCEHFGYTPDEMYSKLIYHCGMEEFVDRDGVVEYLPLTVSQRNKMQMMALIDKVIKFLAEEGIHIETPDEYFEKLAKRSEEPESNYLRKRSRPIELTIKRSKQ